MKYSTEDLRQGMTLRQQALETPSTFGTIHGASDTTAGDKPPKSRMAGQMGARIMDLMTNPVEVQRTQNWMSQFGMSNEGMQFNQAKMMMAGNQPAQPQEEQK
jgi:hypothetical protein